MVVVLRAGAFGSRAGGRLAMESFLDLLELFFELFQPSCICAAGLAGGRGIEDALQTELGAAGTLGSELVI